MVEEKIATINLRRYVKGARWERSKDYVNCLRKILMRHTKTDVKIDKKLNEKLWSSSKPPGKVRVRLVKLDDETTRAELVD
jgi:ribosomal protein L31E